jgi:hypothetical protein
VVLDPSVIGERRVNAAAGSEIGVHVVVQPRSKKYRTADSQLDLVTLRSDSKTTVSRWKQRR